MGVITPVGNDVETFWTSLKNGVSGIRKIETFDTTGYDCRIVETFWVLIRRISLTIRRTSAAPTASPIWRWARPSSRCRTEESTSTR